MDRWIRRAVSIYPAAQAVVAGEEVRSLLQERAAISLAAGAIRISLVPLDARAGADSALRRLAHRSEARRSVAHPDAGASFDTIF